MYKILFFGSDLFSLASFRAVLALHRTQPSVVENVSLVTRRLKPSGRGLKNIREPEIVSFAKQEKVDWHQVENENEFRDLSKLANLAVAVSYGRLIPGSLIQSFEYGGLNVHPSLLPQYRGASPLQYAIMDQAKFTGVSVQTLHPSLFDHGHVLWRSQPIALDRRETTGSLTGKLAVSGAQGLVNVLKSGDIRELAPLEQDSTPSRAPIIHNHLYKVDFGLSAAQLDARGRALSKLWFDQAVVQKKTKSGKLKGHPQLRINLRTFEEVAFVADEAKDAQVGTIWPGKSSSGQTLLALKCSDGFLGAAEITVQGFKPEPAEDYFANIQKRKLGEVLRYN